MKYCIALLAVLAIACSSGDSDQEAKPAARQQPDVHELFVWPAGKGPTRDLTADNDVCRKQTMDVTPALKKLHEYGECMKNKGWELAKRDE